MAVPSLGG